MRYLRGTASEFLSKRRRSWNLSQALSYGSGNFLYIYDDNENLLKITELKDKISFDFLYEAQRDSPFVDENLYNKWAEAILEMGGGK